MAVSLGASGLSGDGGGVLISTGDMASLGYVGNQGGDVDIPLPTGYDWFHVYIRYKTSGTSSNRAIVWFQVKDSAGTRLTTECNSWQSRRNGTHTLEYGSASSWTRLHDFCDGANWNYVQFHLDATYTTRPSITWEGNSTYGSVGSIYHYGSTHYNSVTQYRYIGLNIDNYDLSGMEYRLIGYPE